MAGSKKGQHYVPRFYINEFADKKGRLYVFDKLLRKSYRTQAASIAKETYFYDFPQDGEEDAGGISGADIEISVRPQGVLSNPQIVEDALSDLERNYATEFRGIGQVITKKQPLSREQKYILSHFIAIQSQRTPEYRKLITELHEKALTEVWNRRYEGQSIRVKYNPKYASVAQAADMLNTVKNDKIIQALMGHIWTIGINESNIPFYTSDQPVVRISRGDLRGFASQGIQITLPLTPKCALLIYDRSEFLPLYRDYDDGYIYLDSEDVKHYNGLQVIFSYRQIYCPTGDFLFAAELCAQYPLIASPDQPKVEIS